MKRTDWSDIEFIEDGHVYVYRPEGLVLPGVTTLLREVIDPFAGWRMDPDELAYLGDLGTAVHRGVELYLAGDLDWDTVVFPVRGYVEAAVQAIADWGIRPFDRCELRLGSRALGCAGTMDMPAIVEEAPWPDWAEEGVERVWTLDWKTGKHFHHHRYQFALYSILHAENTGSGGPKATLNGAPLWCRPEQLSPWITVYLRSSGKCKVDIQSSMDDFAVAIDYLRKYHDKNGGWEWTRSET